MVDAQERAYDLEKLSFEDAAGLVRAQIREMYPDTLTIDFWVNRNTQRIWCEIAVPKRSPDNHQKLDTHAVVKMIKEHMVPTLTYTKKPIPPVVKFNVGVPTDRSPVLPPIQKLATGVRTLLQKFVPPSRSNGNNGSQN